MAGLKWIFHLVASLFAAEFCAGETGLRGLQVAEPNSKTVEAWDMSELGKSMIELKHLLERDTVLNYRILTELPAAGVVSFIDTLRNALTAKFQLVEDVLSGISGEGLKLDTAFSPFDRALREKRGKELE